MKTQTNKLVRSDILEHAIVKPVKSTHLRTKNEYNCHLQVTNGLTLSLTISSHKHTSALWGIPVVLHALVRPTLLHHPPDSPIHFLHTTPSDFSSLVHMLLYGIFLNYYYYFRRRSIALNFIKFWAHFAGTVDFKIPIYDIKLSICTVGLFTAAILPVDTGASDKFYKD